MRITVALLAAALAGGAAGATIHAAVTARVAVDCPAPARAAGGDMQRFMAAPAPAPTGNPRY